MAQSVKCSSSKHEGLGVVSFHHVGPQKQTQIVRLGGGTITTVHQAGQCYLRQNLEALENCRVSVLEKGRRRVIHYKLSYLYSNGYLKSLVFHFYLKI